VSFYYLKLQKLSEQKLHEIQHYSHLLSTVDQMLFHFDFSNKLIFLTSKLKSSTK